MDQSTPVSQPLRRGSDARIPVMTPDGPRVVGHAHFWDRVLSRRQLVRGAAGAGAMLAAGLLTPLSVGAAPSPTASPMPIPGGFIGPNGELFHAYGPGPDNEPATITDLNGFVGIAHVQGTGMGVGARVGSTTPIPLAFDADVRFMQGLYVGTDGRHHRGTFIFF